MSIYNEGSNTKVKTMLLASLVPKLSLHVYEKASDGKLGGAWERG